MENELSTLSKPESTTAYSRPKYTITEGKKSYQVKVFMPGVDKEDYSVSLQNDELLVVGEKSIALPTNARWVHREISSTGYKLQLQLNVHIEPEGISAKEENGILTIDLPVTKAALPRTIRIQ